MLLRVMMAFFERAMPQSTSARERPQRKRASLTNVQVVSAGRMVRATMFVESLPLDTIQHKRRIHGAQI